jgi:hypothetical protein
LHPCVNVVFTGMAQQSRALRRLGTSGFEVLAHELSGSELHSVLLAVMQERASGRAAKDVLAHYQRDAFCAPSPVDLRTSAAIDRQFLEAAEQFEAIELSPVAPLGACSTVAVTDQNRVLSSSRMTEVASDPTNVLALECALRLRTTPAAPVHLATTQRVVRAQPIPKLPGYTQHFRLFALASGGQEEKDHAFTVATVVRQIEAMCRGLDRLEGQGYGFGRRRIDILATSDKQRIGDRIAQHLGGLVAREPLDHPYYSGGIRYKIWVTAPDGAEVPLVDGGSFDWLAQIGSNRRAVYVASGAGAQLVALRFQRASGAASGEDG